VVVAKREDRRTKMNVVGVQEWRDRSGINKGRLYAFGGLG
jgi:hypothetical protein